MSVGEKLFRTMLGKTFSSMSDFFVIYIFSFEYIYIMVDVFIENIVIINLATLKIYKTKEEPRSEYTNIEQFKTQIIKCKTILEDCIKNRPSDQDAKTINIYLGKESWTSETNTLGEAWSYNNIGNIRINQWNTGQYNLNDTEEHQNISVIIHEIFHIFGLFPGIIGGNIENITYNINDVDEKTRRIYKGAKGLNGYKKVLLANNITVPDPIFICLEDDFDSGTKNVHLEEGYHDETSNNPLGNEVIEINGQYYPSLHNEIMSGLLDRTNNYITPITMGCLEDFGYTINYKSPYIVTNATNMNFIVDTTTSIQAGKSYNYITLDEDIYDISYLNKVLKGVELNNINILSEIVIEKWGQKIPSR